MPEFLLCACEAYLADRQLHQIVNGDFIFGDNFRAVRTNTLTKISPYQNSMAISQLQYSLIHTIQLSVSDGQHQKGAWSEPNPCASARGKRRKGWKRGAAMKGGAAGQGQIRRNLG